MSELQYLKFLKGQWVEYFGSQPPEHLPVHEIGALIDFFETNGTKPEELTEVPSGGKGKLLSHQYYSKELTISEGLQISDEQEILELITSFRIFDEDRDGVIDIVSLKRAFVSLGRDIKTQSQVDLFERLGDEGVNFEDFCFVATGQRPNPNKYDRAAITAGPKPVKKDKPSPVSPQFDNKKSLIDSSARRERLNRE